MNRVTVYSIHDDRAVPLFAREDVPNFHESIWAFFRKEYLPGSSTGQADNKRLFGLVSDQRIALADRIALASTMPYAVVTKDSAMMALASINVTTKKMKAVDFYPGAFNLARFAEMFTVPDFQRDKKTLGLGIEDVGHEVTWRDWAPFLPARPFDVVKMVECRDLKAAELRIAVMA